MTPVPVPGPRTRAGGMGTRVLLDTPLSASAEVRNSIKIYKQVDPLRFRSDTAVAVIHKEFPGLPPKGRGWEAAWIISDISKLQANLCHQDHTPTLICWKYRGHENVPYAPKPAVPVPRPHRTRAQPYPQTPMSFC